jgi:hypothetical protein
MNGIHISRVGTVTGTGGQSGWLVTGDEKLVWGIRKDGQDFYLLVQGPAFDTRAGHDHLKSIIPTPCSRHDAKAALDAAYDAGTGMDYRKEDNVTIVDFFRPLVMEPAAGDGLTDAERMKRLVVEAAALVDNLEMEYRMHEPGGEKRRQLVRVLDQAMTRYERRRAAYIAIPVWQEAPHA